MPDRVERCAQFFEEFVHGPVRCPLEPAFGDDDRITRTKHDIGRAVPAFEQVSKAQAVFLLRAFVAVDAQKRFRRSLVAPDDLLDALAIATSVEAWEKGSDLCFPGDVAPRDSRGLAMCIQG